MSDASSATQPVVVKVDANLKRLYQAAVHLLASATAAGAIAWHRKYETVADIIEHKPPLYLAGGFSTDAAFCTAILDESQQSVIRSIKVAKLASAGDVAKFSPTKLSYAIAYVEAKNKAPIEGRGAIDFDTLKIQYKHGNKTVTKSLLTITRPELLEAIGQVSGHAKPVKQSPVAKAAVAVVKEAAVEGVQATVTKTQIVLRVPFEGLAAIGKAFADFKMPSS